MARLTTSPYLCGDIMELYTVDTNYVHTLSQADKEVFYDQNYTTKPYVGIIVLNGNYKYFIPLTSAKPKHASWSTSTSTNYLIYETLPKGTSIPQNWVCNTSSNSPNIKHILAVLEIKKMIPVPDNSFSKINFNQVSDLNYRALLLKEYHFLKPLEATIWSKAAKIYNKQINSNVVLPFHCNYRLLESICDKYK